MDLKEYLVSSVSETFETMIFMDIDVTNEDEAAFTPIQDGISGSVGLAGDYMGLVSIHLPTDVALKITEAFLGMEVSEIDDDVKDAIGELANMVGGSIKYMLPEEGKNTQLSIPSVINGKEYSIDVSKSIQSEFVVFETEHGKFVASIQIKKG